jgi:membrane fusion protein, multidrug efflux system
MNESENSALPPARGPRAFIKRHRVALIVFAVAVVLLFIIVRIVQHRPKAVAAGPGLGRGGQNGPVAVSVATVTRGDIQVRIPALGTVTTLANVTVRTQISGTLQKILYTEGQLVREGEVIAQIDPRPYEAALQTAQGNLRRDQALLADARLDLKRYEGLVKEDSIAAQTLDTQRALVDQYAGTIQSDEGQVKTAQVNLLYTRIVSPVTGRVGIRQVDQGNYVTPGDTNGIVVVNQLQPISVLFFIPEDHVSSLMKKVRQGAPMQVEAYDRANAVKLADGKLSTDGSLFPNQFVNISLLQDLLQNQLIMPNSAVRRGAPNGVVSMFVYLVNGAHTVSVRPVTLGVVDGERVAVASGLAAGDVVVTEGGDRLRDGAPVQLPAAAGAPAAGSPAAGSPAAASSDDARPRGARPPGAPHRRPRANSPQ